MKVIQGLSTCARVVMLECIRVTSDKLRAFLASRGPSWMRWVLQVRDASCVSPTSTETPRWEPQSVRNVLKDGSPLLAVPNVRNVLQDPTVIQKETDVRTVNLVNFALFLTRPTVVSFARLVNLRVSKRRRLGEYYYLFICYIFQTSYRMSLFHTLTPQFCFCFQSTACLAFQGHSRVSRVKPPARIVWQKLLLKSPSSHPVRIVHWDG